MSGQRDKAQDMTEDVKNEAANAENTGEETQADTAGDTPEQPDASEALAADASGEPAAGTDDASEVQQLKDRLMRAVAETENLRRRAEKEKTDAIKFGITRFARDLLSVADNMRRAIDALPEDAREKADETAKNLIVGVEMTERELQAVLEKNGIRPLNPPRGEKFDPNQHQAMAEVPTNDVAAGSIMDVFQIGYMIEDRLLRPAMVTVARKDASQDGEKAAQETSEDKADTADESASSGSPGAKIDTSA